MTATGLVCPSCGGRFRAGYTRCGPCGADLVSAEAWAAAKRALDDPRKALEGVPTVAIVHAGLGACREIERELLAAGIRCYVQTDEDGPDPGAAVGVKVGVFVAEAELPEVSRVMRARFADLVAKEGVGAFRAGAIDLAADSVQCPACGHTGALKDGECADCGLFLGAPD